MLLQAKILIYATGSSITIASKTNEAIKLVVNTNQGSSETIVLQNNIATTDEASSIKLNALMAGGVDIDAAADEDIDISATGSSN